MKILIVGDIHGDFIGLSNLLKQFRFRDIECVIQVGDFGIWPKISFKDSRYNLDHLKEIEKPVYFIDGNHEDFWSLWNPEWYEEFSNKYPNIIYQPRGSVRFINNQQFFLLGGRINR
jgi:predicted phosphodiesterase